MISKIFLNGVRALPEFEREFAPGITVVSGRNGSGKTTVLEAVFLLCQGYSFRTRELKGMVAWTSEGAILRGSLRHGAETSERALALGASTTAKVDGEQCKSPAAFFGKFPAVTMQPSDIELVRGAPDLRRRWMDEILCFLSPVNADLLRRYKRVLAQRGEWLRQHKLGNAPAPEIFQVLSSQLASLGAKIWAARLELSDRAGELVSEYYERLSLGADKVTSSYKTAARHLDNLEADFLELLEERREAEFKLAQTLVGPHKDDFTIWSSGYEMRSVGSQGQCRTCAIAMRLAAADLARSGKVPPILLLDDIWAELDGGRRNAVAEIIREKECQVLVATPRSEDIPFTPDDEIRLG